MEDYQLRILELNSKGYCCSQILVQLGLDLLEKNNEQLVNSMKGLCNGLFSGGLCGCLSAGAITLNLILSEEDVPQAVSELVEWFKNVNGKVNCSELLKGKTKAEVCLPVLCQTFERIREIYDDFSCEV
ncbi:MAG: C-GCAxxG-C-C family protein [Dehalobacterium sp.]